MSSIITMFGMVAHFVDFCIILALIKEQLKHKFLIWNKIPFTCSTNGQNCGGNNP